VVDSAVLAAEFRSRQTGQPVALWRCTRIVVYGNAVCSRNTSGLTIRQSGYRTQSSAASVVCVGGQSPRVRTRCYNADQEIN